MPIIVLVLALLVYSWAMLAYPGFRRPGLALGVAVAVGLGAYFWLSDPEGESAATRIAVDELAIDAVAIERTIRGAALSGRVLNRSPGYRLRDMTLSLRLRDCATDLPDCPVVAESSAIARPEAPPGQLRDFTATFLFDTLPPAAEGQRWEWAVTEIRASR